ncbi:MAG: hypothetical protein ABFD50_08015 [Smithella sp.]
MTWTFGGDPQNSLTDQVRLLIGDTDSSDQQITDETISWLLSIRNNDTYAVAIQLSRNLMAKYARMVDSSIESVRESASQLMDHYKVLASQLVIMQAEQYAYNAYGDAVVTGIDIDAMNAADADTNRVGSTFSMNQFNNPPGSTSESVKTGGQSDLLL